MSTPDVAAGPPQTAMASERSESKVGEASAFENLDDLGNSIERGRFAERADLDLAALQAEAAPPLPATLVVTFVSGTGIPSDQEVPIRELATTLAKQLDVELAIVGCSDPSGSAALNKRISQQRAESVAARLAELGVADEQISSVEGRGEDCDDPQRVVRVVPARAPERATGS